VVSDFATPGRFKINWLMNAIVSISSNRVHVYKSL